jgi:hypothetical protein
MTYTVTVFKKLRIVYQDSGENLADAFTSLARHLGCGFRGFDKPSAMSMLKSSSYYQQQIGCAFDELFVKIERSK